MAEPDTFPIWLGFPSIACFSSVLSQNMALRNTAQSVGRMKALGWFKGVGNVTAFQFKKLYVFEAVNYMPQWIVFPELSRLTTAAISGETLDHFLHARDIEFSSREQEHSLNFRHKKSRS